MSEPKDPIESDIAGETKEEKTTRLNFFSDGVRAGLFASGTDILEQMEAAGVPDAASCLLTGSCRYLAEMYESLASKLGIDKSKMREHMLTSAGLYFDTFCEMSVKEMLQGPESAGVQ